MFDRTIPPTFQEIEDINFPWPEMHLLGNHIPLYLLNIGSQPIVEVELVMQSGSYYEASPGAACFMTAMLLEGTISKTTQEIAHIMDYYGATITARSQADFCFISLSTLSKYLNPMLELLVELLLYANFPKKSLNLLKTIKSQAIRMADKKHNQVAYKQFITSLFTREHPYGRSLTVHDVDKIQLENLYDHYDKVFFSNCTAFVSGNITSEALQSIKRALAHLVPKVGIEINYPMYDKLSEKITLMEGKYLQSALVIGKKLLLKKEVDFLPMVIVNELLGGYFGSLLMQRIREEKGYTYGIYSSMVALQQAGYLVITTEVAKEVTKEAIQEIYNEIMLLQHELVSEAMLKKVKNYLLGHFLSTINDPFSIMQKFQAAYLHGVDQSYYTSFYHQVRSITPQDVRSLAQKYLSLSDFTEVIVN